METKALKNINLYTIYQLFGYSLHFYFVIGIFFLTQVKGLNITEFLLLNAIRSLFESLALIPAGIITDKIGRKKCIILGNICFISFGFVLIMSSNFFHLAISSILLGVGSALKSASESSLLIDSLTFLKREEEFSKREGRAFAIFSYVSCGLALISGYIYTSNNYLPIILMIVFSSIALVLSLFFTDIKLKEKTNKTANELSFLKECAKHIFLSKRLRALLLFAFVFAGAITIGGDFSRIALQETGISVAIFAVIQACFWLFAGLGAELQSNIEKRMRNKTLMMLSILYVSSFILISILGLLNLIDNFGFILLILIMFKQYIIEGAYGIGSQKYVASFTSQEVRGKMISILYLVQELGATLFLSIAALTLKRTTSIYASYLTLGIIFFVIFIFVLAYMKKRFGLNPKQYTEEDVRYDT